MTCVHLATSTDADEFMYALAWEVPSDTMADAEAIERLTAMLTEAYGAPTEYTVSGDGSAVTLHREES